MTRVRLAPSAGITRTPAGVVLRSDLGTFQLTGVDVGTFLERIAPLLDGSRDRDGIAAALPAYSPKSVAAFLDLLEKRGLIEAVPEAPQRERWRGQEEFLRRWPGAPADPMDRLARARVLLAGLEPWGAAAAIELSAAGLGDLLLVDDVPRRREAARERLRELAPWSRVEVAGTSALDEEAARDATWDLVVGAMRLEDRALRERLARFAHRAGARSLWSHLAGTTAFLGPLTVPGRTACRACADAEALNPPMAGSAADAGPEADVSGQILGHLTAMEALRAMTEFAPSPLGGQVLRLDPATYETSFHRLVRLPWCEVCGKGAARPA